MRGAGDDRDRFKRLADKSGQSRYGTRVGSFGDWCRSRGKAGINFDYPHIRQMMSRVEAVTSGESRREMIQTCVRHGKTEICTLHAILYQMEKVPGWEHLLLAYDEAYSQKLSSMIRDHARHLGVLDPTSTSVSDWALKNGSRLVCRGAQQGIHGLNAKGITVDDPVGDPSKNLSEAFREQMGTWWTQAVYPRIMPETYVLFTYSPGHYDDLGYRVLAMPGENWHLLRMPAESEGEGDPLGRPQGEFLSPDKLRALSWYEQTKTILMATDPSAWWSYYQCRPTASGGHLAKPDRIEILDQTEKDLGNLERTTRAYDNAYSEKKTADETVGLKCSRMGPYFLVTDVVHGRWEIGPRDQTIASIARLDGLSTHIVLPKDARDEARIAKSIAPLLDGYSYSFEKQDKSKEQRARQMIGAVNLGMVKFLKAPWNDWAMKCLRNFGVSGHDDFVDAMATGYNRVMLSADYRFPFSDEGMVSVLEFEERFGGRLPLRVVLKDDRLSSLSCGIHLGSGDDEMSWVVAASLDPLGRWFVFMAKAYSEKNLGVLADLAKADLMAFDFEPGVVWTDPRISEKDSRGVDRRYRLSAAGLPVASMRRAEPACYGMIEQMCQEKKLAIESSLDTLSAYLRTTPRHPLKSQEIDGRWIGAGAINALRLAVCAPINQPEMVVGTAYDYGSVLA